MVNVIYGGKNFEVPHYVEYVAADKDRKVYGYSIKPKFDGSAGCWGIEYGTGCSVYLGELDAVKNATTYLTRVEAIRTPKKKPKEPVGASNKNEVLEYLIDQLRQQVNNNRCEDLAHEAQSLKNQLRDMQELVDELLGTITLMNGASSRRKEDRHECCHNWRFVNGKAPAVCINCGVTKAEECGHEWCAKTFYGTRVSPTYCRKCGVTK